jgi:hypothetical protein
MQNPNASPALERILDYLQVTISLPDFAPKAIDIAFEMRGMLRNVVKRDDPAFANERSIHLKIGPNPSVRVIAIDKQEIQLLIPE